MSWSGNSNGWQFVSYPIPFISQFNLVQFRFVFTSDSVNTGDGVSIDNFMIFKLDTGIYNAVPEPVCTSLPYYSLITVMDTVTGFNTGDTAIVHIYFGDGTDTITNAIINNNSYTSNQLQYLFET